MIGKIENYYDYITARKKFDGLIVDTNVMLLFIVGNYDKDYIKDFPFKRTACYSKRDFEGLVNVFNHFNKIVITPHTLTELSNLSEKVHCHRIEEYFNVFISVLLKFNELNVDKNIILKSPKLYKFGVADFAIWSIARDKKYLVFTDDDKLSGFLRKKKIDTIHINEIKKKFRE